MVGLQDLNDGYTYYESLRIANSMQIPQFNQAKEPPLSGAKTLSERLG